MFTRCANCRTVFHITAAELRAADGTVICGACGTTFDALESLSETRPKDPPVVEAEAREDVKPPPAAESAAELDERARDEDEFLEELESLIGSEGFLDEPLPADEPLPTDESSGDGFPPMDSPPQPLREEPPVADWSEPDATPGEDEFLVEDFATDFAVEESRFDESLIIDEPFTPDDDEPEPEAPSMAAVAEDDELDDPFLDPDSVFRIDEDVEEGDGGVERVPAASDEAGAWRADRDSDEDQDQDTAEAGGIFAWRDADRAPAETPPENDQDAPAAPRLTESAGPDDGPGEAAVSAAAEEGARATPDGDAEPLPEFARRAGRGRRWPRAVLALIALLLLTGTWVHSQRGKLLRHPAGEALLVPAYGLLGITVAPDWNPAEFRAVQWQAIADGDRPDDLAVAVEFINMATYAQPYPVIRIVLEDRFGRRVGMHDVPPSQYLRDHSRGSRMAGGARLQTTVAVRDPGGRADGFRVDFCLELDGRGLVCGPEPFR